VSYLESAPRCLAAIEEALRSGDSDELAAQAHGLKGISWTIGASVLASACQSLEEAGEEREFEAARSGLARVNAIWAELDDELQHVALCAAAP